MKLITESEIRRITEASRPDVFYIPEGRILSPAARDYLNRQLIPIDVEKNRKTNELLRSRIREEAGESPQKPQQEELSPGKDVQTPPGKYVDQQTGAYYQEKPEYMTQISGNRLVAKDHPVIAYRGKIDSTEALVLYALCSTGENSRLQKDLTDVLDTLRKLMRCEVMEEPVGDLQIIGLGSKELRAQSHDPKKYYGVDPMHMPDIPAGRTYAVLNVLRTQMREAEVLAAAAFHQADGFRRTDIIEALNRLSSALHIMMCRELSGYYKK